MLGVNYHINMYKSVMKRHIGTENSTQRQESETLFVLKGTVFAAGNKKKT